jgi:hypothetical protein
VRVSQFYFALFCPRPGVPVDRDDVFGLFQLRGPYFLCSVTVTRSASTPSSTSRTAVFLLRAAGLVLFPRTTEQYCSRYTVIDFTTRMLTILYIRIDTCQSQRFASAALLYFAVDKLR